MLNWWKTGLKLTIKSKKYTIDSNILAKRYGKHPIYSVK